MADPKGFITIGDFKHLELSGTTHSSMDTSLKFRHGANIAPIFIFPKEGDVYIPSGGIGANDIDVRSRNSSEPFSIILIY